MKKLLEFLHTFLGELAAWAFLTILFGTLSNWFSFALYPFVALSVFGLGITCIGICYAFIINPINDWKEMKKQREEASKK